MGSLCSSGEDATSGQRQEITTDAGKKDEPEPTPAEPEVPAIMVVGCRGLRNADWSWMPGKGVSDAFVKAMIDGKEILKTEVMPNTLEPVFNQEFLLPEGLIESSESIQFEIYDKDPGKADDFLGKCTLAKEAYSSNGFNGEMPLEEAGSKKAFIKLMVRCGGGGYPEGPKSEFEVTLNRESAESFGIEYDGLDDTYLFIGGPLTGLAKDHNDKTTDQNLHLKKNQFIKSVNGISGDVKKMGAELKHQNEVKLTILRPIFFTIALEKTGPLGAVLTNYKDCCFIKDIPEKESAVTTWNSAHKAKEAKKTDRIVSVNGFAGTGDQLMEKLKVNGTQQIVLCRPSSQAELATSGPLGGMMAVWTSWIPGL